MRTDRASLQPGPAIPRIPWAPCALALGLAFSAPACGASSQAREPAPDAAETTQRFDGPAVISGTAIEASTGQPLAGVQIAAPGGAVGTTDALGRFELVGLAEGLSGLLEARTEQGLRGQNRLRPLVSGRLEVVIYLR